MTKNISQDQIDKLYEFMYVCDCMTPNGRGNMTGHTMNIDPEMKRKSYKLFNEIMYPLVGFNDKFIGRYAHYDSPISLHIDGISVLGRKIYTPANTSVLIPLKITPATGRTYTIFFDQRNPYDIQTPDNCEFRQHGVTGWRDDIDYSILRNYTNEPFDEDFRLKYLSHNPSERMFGFSVSEVVEWNIGEVYIFETDVMHGSATFNEIESKDCFLIKTQTDLF